MSLDLGTLMATLGINTQGLTLAQVELIKFAATANTQLNTVQASLARTGKSMQKFGRTMSMSLTLPILAVGAASFKMASDFEASMSKITGLVGVASEQVAEWSKEIIEIAPELGKAPKELAEALFFVTSAGIKGAAAMDVLRASAKASAAGLGETQVVADLVTSAMNAYGKENLSASKATDILVASVREGKAQADALAPALGQVLPIASEMGVSFDQVGAAIAAMTRTGTEARVASTQLKAIMVGLLNPAQQAEDALVSMGSSSRELRKSIKEDGLISVLAELRDMTNQDSAAMSEVFPNVRALSGVLDLMGKNAADNVKVFDSLKDSTGALDRAFEAAAKTAQFKTDQSIAALKATLVSFGDVVTQSVIPIINKFTATLSNVTRWFNALDQEQKENIIKWAAVAAAIGPVIFLLGKLVSGFSALISVGATVIPMLVKFGLLIAANPVVAMAVALGALLGWMIKLRVELENTTKAQKDWNSAFEKGLELQRGTQDIERTMSIVAQLNDRQLNDFLTRLETEKKAEEDFTKTIKEEASARLAADKELAELKEDLLDASLPALQASLQRQIRLRKEAIVEDLQNEYQASRDRIKILNKYAKDANAILSAKKEASPASAPYTAIFSDVPEMEIEIKPRLVFPSMSSADAEIDEFVANSTRTVTGSMFSAFESSMAELTGQMNAMINQFIADTVVFAVESLTVAALSGSMDGFTSFFNTMLGAFGDFIKQMGTMIISYGIAMAAVVAGFTNPFAAIAAGAALVAAGTAITFLATNVQSEVDVAHMASGGMVPKGFPNDTFPAMLSSDETVIPLDKLNQIQPQSENQGKVVFEIAGRKLIGVIQNENKLNKSF